MVLLNFDNFEFERQCTKTSSSLYLIAKTKKKSRRSCWAGNWGIILTNYTLLLITSNHFVMAVSCFPYCCGCPGTEVDAPQHFFLHQRSQAERSYGKPKWEAPSQPSHRWDHCAFRRRTEDVPLSIHFSLGNTNPRTSRMPKDEGVAELIREVSH